MTGADGREFRRYNRQERPDAALIKLVRIEKRRKVEAAGIEREEPSLEGVTQQELAEPAGDVSPQCLHSEGNDRQRLAAEDAILRRVIRCWPALSDETRAAIDSIVVESVLVGD